MTNVFNMDCLRGTATLVDSDSLSNFSSDTAVGDYVEQYDPKCPIVDLKDITDKEALYLFSELCAIMALDFPVRKRYTYNKVTLTFGNKKYQLHYNNEPRGYLWEILFQHYARRGLVYYGLTMKNEEEFLIP